MINSDLPRHQSSEVQVATAPETLFAVLDDHRRLASHMERPSLMTLGASMRIEIDALNGKAVGSVIHMSGNVFGFQLALDEVVTEYAPPFSKAWETRGEPRLLVIGAYRMGFTISPSVVGSRLIVSIDYRLPTQGMPGSSAGVLATPTPPGARVAWRTMPRSHLDEVPEASKNAGMSESAANRPRIATWLMMLCGGWLVCLGTYFAVLRPPLLPEDLRFMGTSLDWKTGCARYSLYWEGSWRARVSLSFSCLIR